MSAPTNTAFVPLWMAELGIKADGPNGWLNMSKAQLRSQQRPDKPLKVQVWATGMLHSPGYNGQEATTMRNKKKVPLTPGDIVQELWKAAREYYEGAGIKANEKEWLALKETKEHLRRALMELEEDGVALRTDGKGTPLCKLSESELRRLPSGRTRIYFWLIPHAANQENVVGEWQDRQEAAFTPDGSDEPENTEVAKPWLPPPPIWQILKVFQIASPDKAQMSDPTYQKLVEEGRVAARKVFMEVVNGWLPKIATEVAADSPPEVATTRGALESKEERKRGYAPIPPSSPPAPPLNREIPAAAVFQNAAAVVSHIASELNIDDDAARQLLTGCKAVEQAITGLEIVELARLKLHAVRQQIQSGKITSVVGLLIRHVPKMCSGATLQEVRERTETEKQHRAGRISYVRESWHELSAEERRECLHKYPELAEIAQGAGND